MGYRSHGHVWIDPIVLIPTEVQETLNMMEYDPETNIYSFEEWKWYSSYPEIKTLEEFLYELDEELWDIVVIGEDEAIVHQPNSIKFNAYTTIEFL